MMRVLLANGADPLRREQGEANALMLAAGLGWRTGDADANDRGTEHDAIAAMALCLEVGLNIDAVDDKGATALHYAVDRGDDVVTFLATRGARFDIRDHEGRTPLDVASRNNDAEVRGGYVRPTTASLLRRLMQGQP
jgi:ankyrin repeat protein